MKEKHTFGFLGHLFAHFKCLMIFVLNKKTVGPFAQCIPLTDAIKQRFPGYPQGRGLKLRFSLGCLSHSKPLSDERVFFVP